jgi:uncharacterized iron-regulated protein
VSEYIGYDTTDLEMAREYQRRLDRLDPEPTAEQLAEAMEWNGTHDWRAYHVAWRVVRAMNGGKVPDHA